MIFRPESNRAKRRLQRRGIKPSAKCIGRILGIDVAVRFS